VIPQRKTNRAAFSIRSSERVLIQNSIFARRSTQKFGFFFIEHAPNQDVSVSTVSVDLASRYGSFGHRRLLPFSAKVHRESPRARIRSRETERRMDCSPEAIFTMRTVVNPKPACQHLSAAHIYSLRVGTIRPGRRAQNSWG
jgi:hypothetical protein